MSPRKESTAFRFDADLLAAMRQYKATEGVPVTVQFEMAARAWLKSKGVTVKKAERKRAATRRRS